MKKLFPLLLLGIALSACTTLTPLSPTSTPLPLRTATLTLTAAPTVTQTPPAPSATPTQTLDQLERPVFLAWPLPASIGRARISQYPNTAWSWNYLGLNPGYQCPPMFGYLLNLDSLAYWRELSIPEAQDKAQADPHNFEMVECYSPHEGTDIKAPAGTPVYAAADGKVQEWRLTGLNSMIVLKHCLGGNWDAGQQCLHGKQWYTTYMHIIPDPDLLVENLEIKQGAQLGTIYDQTINSHLHLEVGLDKRSYANVVNPWGADHAPWLGCLWLDQALCVDPGPENKLLALYTSAGRLFIKQGQEEPIEVQTAQGLTHLHLWGKRIAALDPENRLLLSQRTYPGGSPSDDFENWKLLAENLLDFQLTEHRVAILDTDHNLWTKEHDTDGEWLLQAENVSAFSLSENRLGYLAGNGDLLVREGSLKNDWVVVAHQVLAFQLIDSRIAYLDQLGSLYANEGQLLSEYRQMASAVRAFQLTDLRLGIIDHDYNLLVKEGNLRADWVPQAPNVKSFQLAGDRILMLGTDGAFKLKQGNLYQPWSALTFPDLKDVLLNAPQPALFP